MIETAMNATPMKNFVAALSMLIGVPRRVFPHDLSIWSFPVITSETFARSVPQLRQNLPVSGF
jgi:hypothetical protein